MLNLANRSKAWLVGSIFITTAVSAQQSKRQMNEQGSLEQASSNHQMTSSYSAPANFDVRNSWDIYATGSFIYWQARQENIEIGLISANDAEDRLQTTDLTPFNTSYVNNTTITSPNFTFRPGVKFGLGANLNWDGWNAYAEYTWFHGSIGSGVKPLIPSTATSGVPNGQYLYPIQGTPLSTMLFFMSADQSWSLKMDFADLSLARAYYSGTKLTVRSFFGARGAWIRQRLSTFYAGNATYEGEFNLLNLRIWNHLASWGIGPRAGFESNWLLGAGCRLIGNGSLDILYTRYSMHFNQQAFFVITPPTLSPILSNASVSQKIDYLRAHLDLEMGFGWGTYLSNNAYHFDLSASYGFQVFWSQNMFRNFFTTRMPLKSINTSGNLYIHGLSMNARFDF